MHRATKKRSRRGGTRAFAADAPDPISSSAAPPPSSCARCSPERTALLDEREAKLVARDLALDQRESAILVTEAALDRRLGELERREHELEARKAALDARSMTLEVEQQRTVTARDVRRANVRAKIEERMKLAATVGRLPSSNPPGGGDQPTVKEALAQMGKSYQDLSEGNGFLVAGKMYDSVERFLELFDPQEKLTVITRVARLFDVIVRCKFARASGGGKEAEAEEEPIEERSKGMLHSFRRRVRTKSAMDKVLRWLEKLGAGAPSGVSEDGISELLYHVLPESDGEESEEDEERREAAAAGDSPAAAGSRKRARRFKPPAPLPELPTKTSLRDDKLKAKILLADAYDDCPDKALFYHQHGKFNVLIGRALRTVCEAFRVRGDGMGRLGGARFFFGLFPAGQSGRRKHADLGSVEETAVLLAALGGEDGSDEENIREVARLVDTPEQMASIAELAHTMVEHASASLRDKDDALKRLKRLTKEIAANRRRDAVRTFTRKYVSSEVPLHTRRLSEHVTLLQKHIGDCVLDVFFELSRLDLGDEMDVRALGTALSSFCEMVDRAHDDDELKFTPEARDTYVSAAMLLFKCHRPINKATGSEGAKRMAVAFAQLGGLFGTPGRTTPVLDVDTGSDEHLWDWPAFEKEKQ
jgi:hypothetical protein